MQDEQAHDGGLRLTGYARRRLDQPGISMRQIRRALEDPTRIEPSPHGPERWVHHRTVDGRRLRVVVERTVGSQGPPRVVTAWWAEPPVSGR